MSRVKMGESYKEFCAGYRETKAWLGERGADRSDCRDFFNASRADLQTAHASGLSWSRLGHDFYLTRNGHGAGFWDEGHRGAEADAALDRLTRDAHAYGSTE
ncbi:MAG: hypothetical protein KGK07_15150 [Chloroflexota bacterium]|nr:hypothetical protein [Chloroflexota bacterium]